MGFRIGFHALLAFGIVLAADDARGQSAFVSITASQGIDASSYNANSIVVTNDSTGDGRIISVRFDLSSALFPDIVFDPQGTAGDEAAKCFSANTGAATVGLVAPADPCFSPFSGSHDSGYDAIELSFSDFDPTETFAFSVDIDPTSIRGTSGSSLGGSVSGLELTGAAVIVTFDDDTVLAGQIFRQTGSDGGGENTIRAGAPATPSIQALALASPSSTSDSSQVIRIAGPVGETVRLLQVEGMLDLNGGAGFDLDPFEANRAIVVGETAATIGDSGSVDVAVILTRTNDAAGFNYFMAAIVDGDGSGRTGATSNVVVLELVSAPPECAIDADCDDGNECTTDTCGGGLCSRTNNSASCDDGNACTTGDACENGTCVGLIPVACDDGSACNGVETCHPELGCRAGEPVDCSDPGECQVNPRCEDGECVADPLCDPLCESCSAEAGCLSRCGHPSSDPSSAIVATDALVVLIAAVNGSGCLPCICDVDASGAIVATDALMLLSKVVDANIVVDCQGPPAVLTSTTTTTVP
jgi:hypothetical protein